LFILAHLLCLWPLFAAQISLTAHMKTNSQCIIAHVADDTHQHVTVQWCIALLTSESVCVACRERVTFEHKWHIPVCDLELDQTSNIQGHCWLLTSPGNTTVSQMTAAFYQYILCPKIIPYPTRLHHSTSLVCSISTWMICHF